MRAQAVWPLPLAPRASKRLILADSRAVAVYCGRRGLTCDTARPAVAASLARVERASRVARVEAVLGLPAQWFRSPCSSNCCARGRARCSGRWRRCRPCCGRWCRRCSIRRRPAICRWCWRSATNSSSAPTSARRSRSGSPRSPIAPAGMFGVYLLSQICIVVTYLGGVRARPRHRRRVARGDGGAADGRHRGVLGADAGVRPGHPRDAALGADAVALLARGAARTNGSTGSRSGVEAGLLLLTTYAGLILIALLVVCSCCRPRAGARNLATIGPWIAGVVVVAVLFPYLIWLDLSGGTSAASISRTIGGNLRALGAGSLVALLRRPCRACHPGRARRAARSSARDARPPEVDARAGRSRRRARFVYFFALAPVVAMAPVRAADPAAGELRRLPPLVVLSGLAVIVAAGDRIRIEHQYLIGYVWAALLVLPPLLVALAIVVQPWIFAGRSAGRAAGGGDGTILRRQLSAPHRQAARDRRPAISRLASLVALAAPSRPSLYLESAAEYLPRVTSATSTRRARSWSGRRPTRPAGRRPRSRGSFPIWWPRCRTLFDGASRAACR